MTAAAGRPAIISTGKTTDQVANPLYSPPSCRHSRLASHSVLGCILRAGVNERPCVHSTGALPRCTTASWRQDRQVDDGAGGTGARFADARPFPPLPLAMPHLSAAPHSTHEIVLAGRQHKKKVQVGPVGGVHPPPPACTSAGQACPSRQAYADVQALAHRLCTDYAPIMHGQMCRPTVMVHGHVAAECAAPPSELQ
jgi:hypothetical protein